MSMNIQSLESKEAYAEFGAKIFRSVENSQKQRPLQIVTMSRLQVDKELLEDYGTRYSLEWSSTGGLHNQNGMKNCSIRLQEDYKSFRKVVPAFQENQKQQNR